MEGMPNNESVERNVLVEALKTKGIEDAETKELLIKWTEAQEQKVEAEGTREAQVRFEMDRAVLCFDAGFDDDGVTTLMEAQMIADQENLPELLDEIKKLWETVNRT